MSFEHPGFFLLLFLIPLLVLGAVLAWRRRGARWRQLVASRLLPILVRERPQLFRWIAFAVFLIGFALLIAALTAPNAGYLEQPDTIRGRNILLAVDVSKSMLATDEAPSRLGAARAAALELLDRFPNDRVGVIAFSGVAWLQAPLTVDHNAVREVFLQLEFQDTANEWVPRSGSDLSVAVELALKTFRETGQRNNALIVLSDGEAHQGSVEQAAERAEEAGVTVFTVGFGSDDGGFLPDPDSRDGKLHDRSGNLVLSRLNTEDLQLLANRTGGFYIPGSGQGFTDTLEQAVARLDRYELEGRNRRIAIPRFQWFLAPAMVCFILGMLLNTTWRLGSRSAAAIGIVGALLLSSTGEAGLIPRTEAERAYRAGDHQRALDLFEGEVASAEGERKARLQLGEAAAAYRLRQFGRASRAYSGALLSGDRTVQEQAHFGLGNTQFFLGLGQLNEGGDASASPDPGLLEEVELSWVDAIGHYDGVLALDPDHKEALDNRAYVQKRLEELRREQEKQEQQQKEQEKDQNDEQSEEDPKEDPEQDDNQKEKGEDPQEGDGNAEDENSENQQPGGNPDEKEAPEKSPSSQSQESDPENSEPRDSEDGASGKPLEKNPGETAEEFARRILNDNADFQEKPLPLRFRNLPRPEKDW